MNNFELLKKECKEIKIAAFEMLVSKGGGHFGGSFSCAEILTSLFFNILRKKDKFIMSKAHASVIMYSTFSKKKIINKKILRSYGQENSLLGVHAEHDLLDSVEFSCGSLGHGLSHSCGLALGYKKKKINVKIYCLIGDGEMQEGSIWEALLFAAHHKLNNLYVMLDNNKKQSSGLVKDILNLEPIKKKISSFNFDVKSCNGHDIKDIITKIKSFKNYNKPKFLIANTIKGKGIKFLENKIDCHYDVLDKNVIEKYKKDLSQ